MPAENLANDFLKCAAKIPRKRGIDERINGRVAISQPKNDAKCQIRNAFVTKRRHKVHGEKWKPTADETTHDDAKSLCGLSLHSKSTDLKWISWVQSAAPHKIHQSIRTQVNASPSCQD